MSAKTPINTVEDLLAHANELEAEAAERYEDLAAQMEAHNNPAVARMFKAMAAVEAKHLAYLSDLSKGHTLPEMNPSDFSWPDLEAPESVPIGKGHYQMTEHDALALALECEQGALKFYDDIVRQATDPATRKLAASFVEDERRHVELVQKWIDRLPPRKPALVDLDEAIEQE
jgi:rubrerythrin